MPNGTGLSGDWSTTQSALIVPFPGNAAKYYLFTLQVAALSSDGDLTYSVVDMNLNNGLGDIVATEKKRLVATNLTEKLVSANSADCSIWVITHQRNNNRFEARLITENGIGAPVLSDAGSVHSADPPNGENGLTGTMKVSKNNLKIGVANLQRVIEVFDFNRATGIISNPISLPMDTPNAGYGVCFSPDNTKFYITEGMNPGTSFKIYQYDLSSGNAATIIASRKFLGEVVNQYFRIGDLQIGPDNRIYFAEPDLHYLGVIDKPDLTATLCGFNLNGVFLGEGKSVCGLPNEIRYAAGVISLNLGNDTTLCPGDMLNLSAPNALTYRWSTGATTQTIRAPSPGKYWVEIRSGSCTFSDTIHILSPLQKIGLGKDTTLCKNETLLLDAGIADSYSWSTGATSQTITVTASGQYWVKAFSGNCTASDTINITVSNTLICDCALYMPNAFTPNNDGRNDLFRPAKKGGCEFLSLLIYNRWGQKVFETSDLNKGWDGKYTGKDETAGVFIWQIIAQKDGIKKVFKGTVMLLR